jgi:hypothetical protein
MTSLSERVPDRGGFLQAIEKPGDRIHHRQLGHDRTDLEIGRTNGGSTLVTPKRCACRAASCLGKVTIRSVSAITAAPS